MQGCIRTLSGILHLISSYHDSLLYMGLSHVFVYQDICRQFAEKMMLLRQVYGPGVICDMGATCIVLKYTVHVGPTFMNEGLGGVLRHK